MIHPLTPEADWLDFLSGFPEREMPNAPALLVISPHPDDETLGCGGLIQHQVERGGKVIVLAVTDGEFAYPGEPRLASMRRKEQTKALHKLGVPAHDIHRLGLPDGNVASREKELMLKLEELLTKGMRIVTPWIHDVHPDHEACARAAALAAKHHRNPLSSYFFWTWNRSPISMLEGQNLFRLPLTAHQQSVKELALQCHPSQLYRDGGEPILPEELLSPARRTFEVFLDA